MERLVNWRRFGIISIGGASLICLILLTFVWPSSTAVLKHFPLAIVSPEHVDQMPFMLMYAEHDEFALQTAPSRAAAVNLIQQRQVYGAIVLGAQPEVLMASANGDVVSSLMSEVSLGLQQRLNIDASMTHSAAPTMIRTDIVPRVKSTFDLALVSLPLMIGGILGGVVSSLFMPPRNKRLYFLISYAFLAGVGFTLILHSWLNLLPGQFFVLTTTIALTLFALSTAISGLYSLIGLPGLGLGAVYTLLLANPIGGLLVPLEVLLEPWGAVGHWLAPGAAAQVLHSATYFPSAPARLAWIVLTIWAALGAGMVFLGRRPALLKHFQ